MPVSVHLTSTNGMQVFENTRVFFCLRSKRSAVRICPGVPEILLQRPEDLHADHLAVAAASGIAFAIASDGAGEARGEARPSRPRGVFRAAPEVALALVMNLWRPPKE